MKSFKYTINGNVYKVHINSVVEDIAEVEVNGTPFKVKMEKPTKKQVV
ncbi:MAG: acetyl-CoA carboxylase biotin carboxyl carrier protein subunit, partial [Tannerellaceae bacterium]|nr:acetyl-CoA carboxylase biotin carboxyl carrier protein subunit [Tannerellaceae bacterium]